MTIKEVSKMFDLSNDTLRYYEKKGLIGPILKKNGIRSYNETDLKRIEFIKCMRSAEVPIDVLKKYIDLFELGDETLFKRKELLEEQNKILKEKIDNMQKAYNKLNEKIKLHYEGKIDEYLKKSKVNS